MLLSRSRPLPALLLVTFAAPCLGEESNWPSFEEFVLHRVEGDVAGDWFGIATAAVGDVNGDGVPDFAVGAHQNVNFGPRPAPDAPPGYVAVFSGADGERIHTLRGVGSKEIDGGDDHFGNAICAIDDVDGDDASEIVVGAYLYDGGDAIERSSDENTGGVFVFSGASGKVLRRLPGLRWGDRYGTSLAQIPDVDGDGRPDLVIGVEKADDPRPLRGKRINNEGSLEILSTGTQEVVSRSFGTGYNAHMGHCIAPVGDIDGDGLPDVAAGAFLYSYDGLERKKMPERLEQRGAAGIFSTRKGRPIVLWKGRAAHDWFGFSIASLSREVGDSVRKLAVGAIQSGWVGDYHGPGYVQFYSTRDGTLLGEVQGEEDGDQFGWSLTNVGDRDGDGRADLLVGAPASITVSKDERLDRRGRAYLYSGSDHERLLELVGLEVNDQFGASAASIGDVNGDGLSDVLVGAPRNVVGQTRAGYAVVLSGELFDLGGS